MAGMAGRRGNEATGRRLVLGQIDVRPGTGTSPYSMLDAAGRISF